MNRMRHDDANVSIGSWMCVCLMRLIHLEMQVLQGDVGRISRLIYNEHIWIW